MTDTYIATESGACEIDGEAFVFVKGKTLVEEGHPLLDSVPDYFAPANDAAHYKAPATSGTTGGRSKAKA